MKKCTTCDKEFSSTGSLKRHIKRIHDKDKRCKVCNDIFIPKTSEVTCSKVCRKEQAKRRVARKMQDPKRMEVSRSTKKRWKDKTRHLRNKYDDLNKQDRQCNICEKDYIGHFQSITCSKECNLIHRTQKRKQREPPKVEVFKDCEQCDKPFKAFHKNNKFCSDACSHRHRNPLKPKYHEQDCEWCGNSFQSYLGEAKYCSITCANKVRHQKWLAANPIQPKDCLYCSETFTPSTRAKDSKYCSNKCLKRHWEERNPKPTIEKEERVCVICSTLFKTARLKGISRKITCSKECSSVKKAQDKHEKNKKNKQIIPCEICNKEFHKVGNKYTCGKVCQNIKKRKTWNTWMDNNPHQKISQRISGRVVRSLKGIRPETKLFELLGYTKEELKQHLESLFKDGMTWENSKDNYNSKGMWHIDHRRPVSSFNFDSTDHPDFTKCWTLNNLQPLWAEDNIRKGDTWGGEDS